MVNVRERVAFFKQPCSSTEGNIQSGHVAGFIGFPQILERKFSRVRRCRNILQSETDRSVFLGPQSVFDLAFGTQGDIDQLLGAW